MPEQPAERSVLVYAPHAHVHLGEMCHSSSMSSAFQDQPHKTTAGRGAHKAAACCSWGGGARGFCGERTEVGSNCHLESIWWKWALTSSWAPRVSVKQTMTETAQKRCNDSLQPQRIVACMRSCVWLWFSGKVPRCTAGVETYCPAF